MRKGGLATAASVGKGVVLLGQLNRLVVCYGSTAQVGAKTVGRKANPSAALCLNLRCSLTFLYFPANLFCPLINLIGRVIGISINAQWLINDFSFEFLHLLLKKIDCTAIVFVA